jgi:hypothetical protein
MEWITKFEEGIFQFFPLKKETKEKTSTEIGPIMPKFDKHIFVPGSFFG